MSKKVEWKTNSYGKLIPVCPYCETVYGDGDIFNVKNYPSDGGAIMFLECEDCKEEASLNFDWDTIKAGGELADDWAKCKKKPIVVEFREVKGNSEQIETLESEGREGILTAHADKDFIIRGVDGEVYPIKKEIFYKTYEVLR